MQFGKRILLFLGLNILVMTTVSILLVVFHAQTYLTPYGLDIPKLAVFSLVWGMAGLLMSLAMSRAMAKWMYGVQLIDQNNCSQRERWLLQTVHKLCEQAGIYTMPEVGIYQSQEANAFATGPTKSRALVACSSGLFGVMNDDEIEGVLGHEISHVANGDMVTITLLQGVVNAFAIFASRIIAYVISRNSRSRDDSGSYWIAMLLQVVFLLLGSILVAFYNRHRECSADDGGANLAGKNKMIGALEALQRTYDYVDSRAQPEAQTMKISSRPAGIFGLGKLWATHPPLEERIARLRNKIG